MIVEPGTLKTEFRVSAIESRHEEITDYSKTAGASRQYLKDHPYNQSGDPFRTGEAICQAVQLSDKPKVLIPGKGMIEATDQKPEIEKWR